MAVPRHALPPSRTNLGGLLAVDEFILRITYIVCISVRLNGLMFFGSGHRLRAEPGDPGNKGHFLLNRKIPQAPLSPQNIRHRFSPLLESFLVSFLLVRDAACHALTDAQESEGPGPEPQSSESSKFKNAL